jgi:hypothetical protein
MTSGDRVGRTEIAISLLSEDHASEDEQDNPPVLTVPWSKASHRRHRHVIAPEDASRTQVVPIRSDTRLSLRRRCSVGAEPIQGLLAGLSEIAILGPHLAVRREVKAGMHRSRGLFGILTWHTTTGRLGPSASSCG